MLQGTRTGSQRLLVSLSQAKTYRCSYGVSPLLDFRRQKLRRQWRSPEDPEAEFTIFPNVRHGRNYDLNWEFNAYQVTPSEEAYRNLHLRGLQMLTPSKSDKEKTVVLQTEEPKDHKIYFLPSEKLVGEHNVVMEDAWKVAIRQVRSSLSFEPELFMHDGVIGSSRSASIGARLMFNSPAAALQLHFAMAPIPAVHPGKFPHDITGWMLETDNFSFPREQFGIETNNYTIIDLAKRRFIVVGKLTQSVIRKSLLAVSADSFTEKDSLLLNCDSVTNGEETGLVFSQSGAPLSSKGNLSLFSARNTIWSPRGLSRTWDSVSYESVPEIAKRGDIHEKIGNKTRFTTKLDTSSYGRVGPAPKFAIFFKEGNNSVSKLTATETRSLLEKEDSFILSPAINREEFSGKLEQLFSEYDTTCYLVSGKASDIKDIIDGAFKGNLSSTSNTTKSKPKASGKKK